MARASCKVRFGSFRWSRKDYADVMGSPEVQSLVKRPAREMADRLTSSYRREPGELGSPYVVKPVQGRLAKGYIVGTGTPGAMRRELRENAMKREADGGA